LLARYGILTREVATLEELPGGFAALYPVLEAMEEAGRAQRGYFIDGVGGAQFAQASMGAVDRLRACAAAESPARVLAATDPANPFGWALPWPSDRARRAQGARVVIVDTEPVLFLTSNGKNVFSLPAASDSARLQAAVTALRSTSTKALRFDKIDGEDARFSALGKRLLTLGFVSAYRGIELR
jgi:ATP-dependent Lhr-like helicase